MTEETLLAHHCRTASHYDNSPQSDFIPTPSTSPIPDFDLFQDIQQLSTYPSYLPQAIDLSYRGPEIDEYILDSRQSTPYDHNFNNHQDAQDTQYMTHNFAPNPRLRVQQSTPRNGLRSSNTPPPMSEGSNWVQPSWNNLSDQAYLTPQATQQQYNTQQGFRSHKRLSSDSSVGSTGPDSPYTQSTVYPHIVDPDSQSASSPLLEPYDTSYQQFSKPHYYSQANALNTPFVNPAFQNLNLGGNDAVTGVPGANMLGDYQATMNLNAAQRNTRRSFTGSGNAGAPMGLTTNIPKLDRTVSDVYQDELYDSSIPSTAPSQPQLALSQVSLLSPNRSMFNDRLRQANTARSESPSTDMARERSPFREDSEYANQSYSQAPSASGISQLKSAAQMRQQQKMQEDAQAYAQHHPRPVQHDFGVAPNTISPKEALLEYDDGSEDAKTSSVPQIKREADFSSAQAGLSSFVRESNTSSNGIDNNNGSETGNHEYASISSGRHPTSDLSSSQQSNMSSYTFMPPSLPTDTTQRYAFMNNPRRQSSSIRSGQSDQVPEFPTLTSMESTKSDSGQEQIIRPPAFASQETSLSQRSEAGSPLPRPTDTSAHTNTYICVAQNCTARFDNSTKLHKHRRENHRNTPNQAASPSTPSSSTSQTPNPQAAANNISRNNAPGPHKCERTNPSTGKPCNTVFSRSYDLTRHEDTIHNNRKQKVRCHLCTEEKTFSRNDALTRHMRVVHPDVDFPGRNRRRG